MTQASGTAWRDESRRVGIVPRWLHLAGWAAPLSVVAVWALACVGSAVLTSTAPEALARGPWGAIISIAFFAVPLVAIASVALAVLVLGPARGQIGVDGDRLVIVRRGREVSVPIASLRDLRCTRTVAGPSLRGRLDDGRQLWVHGRSDAAAVALYEAVAAHAPECRLVLSGLRTPLVFVLFPFAFVGAVLVAFCLCPGMLAGVARSLDPREEAIWAAAAMAAAGALGLAAWLGLGPGVVAGWVTIDAARACLRLGRWPFAREVSAGAIESVSAEPNRIVVVERGGRRRTERIWLTGGPLLDFFARRAAALAQPIRSGVSG